MDFVALQLQKGITGRWYGYSQMDMKFDWRLISHNIPNVLHKHTVYRWRDYGSKRLLAPAEYTRLAGEDALDFGSCVDWLVQ